MSRFGTILSVAAFLAASPALAAGDNVTIDPPAEGSVSIEAGLAAWSHIYEVTSHPRCSNCHVGASNIPMWSGPSYGRTRPHGMNINAGESRIGAESLLCSTCRLARGSGINPTPHAAPRSFRARPAKHLAITSAVAAFVAAPPASCDRKPEEAPEDRSPPRDRTSACRGDPLLSSDQKLSGSI